MATSLRNEAIIYRARKPAYYLQVRLVGQITVSNKGEMWGEGINQEFRINIYTLLYIK